MQLAHPGFEDYVSEVIRETGIDPRRVELASARVANTIVDLKIGGVGDGTLREFNALAVL